MEIAVIDDGVQQGFAPLHIASSYCFYTNKRSNCSQVIISHAPRLSHNTLTHGTVCASIISKINPCAKIIDLRILNEKKASIDALLAALSWCCDNKVKIINLSLGTLSYHDFQKMSCIINKLLFANTIIVSAYHNMNIITYPASIPGVFGIRNDRANVLKEGDFTIEDNYGLLPENCIVSCMKNFFISHSMCIPTASQNSFAAPAITGYISNYLMKKPNADFYQVLAHIQKNAIPCLSSANKLHTVIQTENYSVQSVVIGCTALSDSVITSRLHNLFKNSGYAIETFYRYNPPAYCEDAIPLSQYFLHNICVDKAILYTLYFIYSPDIMIFCPEKEKQYIDQSLCDVVISIENGEIVMKTEKKRTPCASVEQLFHEIVDFYRALR